MIVNNMNVDAFYEYIMEQISSPEDMAALCYKILDYVSIIESNIAEDQSEDNEAYLRQKTFAVRIQTIAQQINSLYR